MTGAIEVVRFPVRGMTCDHCVGTVRRALEGVPGVLSATVDLAQGRAEVTFDPAKADRERLKTAVAGVGYQVPDDEAAAQAVASPQLVTIGNGPIRPPAPPMATVPIPLPEDLRVEQGLGTPHEEEWNLSIGGMHCASCVARVEGALSGVPGVSAARVNLATERASVVVEHGRVREEQLAEAAARAGYSARRAGTDLANEAESLRRERAEQLAYWRNRLIVGAVLTVPLVVLGYGPMLAPSAFGHGAWVGWAMFVPATVLQVYLGGPYLRGAWTRLKQGSTNMDTLIALGTTTAYGYSVVQLLIGHARQASSLRVIAALVLIVSVTAIGAVFFGGATHRDDLHQHH